MLERTPIYDEVSAEFSYPVEPSPVLDWDCYVASQRLIGLKAVTDMLVNLRERWFTNEG